MPETRCFRCGEIIDRHKCDTEEIRDRNIGTLIRHFRKDDCVNSLFLSVRQQEQQLERLQADIESLRAQAEMGQALEMLIEMNLNRHERIYDLGVMTLDDEVTWMVFDNRTPFEPIGSGLTVIAAIESAKSKIEGERG